MKRVVKIIVILLVFIVVTFLLYIYKLHSLSLEGNVIFEQRCLAVNPSLIAYKNFFLNFVNAVKNPGEFTSNQTADFYVSYLRVSDTMLRKKMSGLKPKLNL